MVVSEEYIKVPGKQYKVKVQCVSTRRLTTMEWLIVNCASKFQGSSQTASQKLKYVFEEIFQLTSSEILIKPCIESLINEQAILLDVGANFDYNNLLFSQIRLTEKGKKMAEDGLFPGEQKELPLDIYYNPLSEKMNQYVGGNEKVDDAIEFGTESDYEANFPEDKIIEALHKGLVGRGKFVASKLRIESIECITSQDWDSYLKLEVDVNEKGIITTKPVIKEENVKPLVSRLFFTKELSSEKMDTLVWAETTEPRTIIGSGKKLKEGFLNISRNGSVIGVSNDVYALYKRTTTAFKQKTVFLWGTKELGVEKGNESYFISLPFVFGVDGCVAINEKNESISFCKNKYSYDGKEIIVPVAIVDKRIKAGGNDLNVWIEKVIQDYFLSDIRYLSLYSLKLWKNSEKKAVGLLCDKWKDASIDQVIDDLSIISKMCQSLGTEMFKLDELGDLLWSKLEALDTDNILSKMGMVSEMNCFAPGSSTQKFILQNIVSRAEAPTNYNELFVLIQSVGIRNHDEALIYDDIFEKLYTRELIVDTLKVIIEDKYTKLPELFGLDIFFNEYVQAMKELEFLVDGLKLFQKSDVVAVGKSIEKCVDVALVQSYAAEIQSKNAEFLNRGINVYTEMKNIDAEKADNLFENLDLIKEKVKAMMDEETKSTISKVKNSDEKEEPILQKMYIIDTCALMHHPDLLLYFKDDEFVRIPTKVIDELGKIKDMRSSKYSPDLSRTATRLAYDIERRYLKLFNQSNKMRLMIENAELDLLPEELDKNVPDNQILSVALKYGEWKTVIISDDGVFRLTSLAQSIEAVTSEDFIKEHEIYKKSIDRWIEKFEKAGGILATKPAVELAKPQNPVHVSLEEKDTTAALVSLEEGKFSDTAIDILPIRELKKYLAKDLKEQAFTLLQNNGIKTIGQFKKLTRTEVEGFKAKGKQTIFRNDIIRALDKFEKMVNPIATVETESVQNEETV